MLEYFECPPVFQASAHSEGIMVSIEALAYQNTHLRAVQGLSTREILKLSITLILFLLSFALLITLISLHLQ